MKIELFGLVDQIIIKVNVRCGIIRAPMEVYRNFIIKAFDGVLTRVKKTSQRVGVLCVKNLFTSLGLPCRHLEEEVRVDSLLFIISMKD